MKIGSTRQLFIDDYLIESLEGASKQLNQPSKHPQNPLLPMAPADSSSWDADMPVQFGSVVFDEEESVFKMWYGLWERGGKDDASVLAYASSPDGIAWHKPTLGLHDYRGTRENNLVRTRCGIACGVFKDRPGTDAAARYKMLYVNGSEQVCAARSADGLQWTEDADRNPVIFHPPGHDSQPVLYWDDELDKYVAIIRNRTRKIAAARNDIISNEAARNSYQQLWSGAVPDKKSLRVVGQAESDNFVDWTPMRVVLEADSQDPLLQGEFYNMEVLPYEGVRIGLMTVFSYSSDYCRAQVQLTFSRDGMHWERAGDREVFLPISDCVNDLDWGRIYPFQRPLVVGDEIWIYYTADATDHDLRRPHDAEGQENGIALATLRLDGFVSVDARGEGMLTTKPFTFTGSKLVVNADAAQGRLCVEILDAAGSPVPGFGSGDCEGIESDAIHQLVTWNGRAELNSLEGKTVKLKFTLNQSRLFSFKFE